MKNLVKSSVVAMVLFGATVPAFAGVGGGAPRPIVIVDQHVSGGIPRPAVMTTQEHVSGGIPRP